MKILITGCKGFIGKHLTKALAVKGYRVRGMDIMDDTSDASGYEYIKGDICDKSAVERAVKGVDIIIHLAAKHHDFGISYEEYFTVNKGGTKNLLDAADRDGIKKIIFLSSVAVYGKYEADDDTLPIPVSDYGKSKLAAEKEIREWTESDSSKSAVILRPPVVFGVDNFANMYNLIDKIIRKKFFWIGNGSNIKSVTYSDNLIAAIVFLLERMKPGCKIYNYSDEPHMTTKQIVDTIAKYGNVTVPKVKIPLFIACIGGSIMDILSKMTKTNFPITGMRVKKFNTQTYFKSKKIRELGFRQPVSLDEGFNKTVDWYLKNKSV